MKKKVAAVTASLFISILVLAAVAFAQEKENECPKEFDPYDPAWVLYIAEPEEEYFSWDRLYGYQPDPTLRVRGQLIKACKGITFSFLVEGRERLIWKIIYDGDDEKHFLRNEDKEWVQGTRVFNTKPETLVPGGKLVLHLYREDNIVAVRTIPVPMDYDWARAKAEKEKRREAEREASQEEK